MEWSVVECSGKQCTVVKCIVVWWSVVQCTVL